MNNFEKIFGSHEERIKEAKWLLEDYRDGGIVGLISEEAYDMEDDTQIEEIEPDIEAFDKVIAFLEKLIDADFVRYE